MRCREFLFAAALALAGACPHLPFAQAQAAQAPPDGGQVRYTEQREPCANRNPYRNAYFGDLHIHTSYSYDARPLGVTAVPADAYRYAQGEEISLPPPHEGAKPATARRLGPPLDFAAVTDHSEFFGELKLCADQNSVAYASRSCEAFRRGGPTAILLLVRGLSRDIPARNADICGEDGLRCREAATTYWQRTREMAEAAYDRSSSCGFTSFVAYEHSGTPNSNAYHRNVIFRNAMAPDLPASSFEAPTGPALWDSLTRECLDGIKGCDVLAIPHSSNLSSGSLFPSAAAAGSDPGARQAAMLLAQRRNALEPIMEIFQHKGSSECFNGLPGIIGGPDDLCDMEELRRYYRGLPAVNNSPPICAEGETGVGGSLNAGCVSSRDFFRSTLLAGLQHGRELGVNPYQFGVIGSTDTHLATAGDVDESRWHGHTVSETVLAERLTASPVHPIGLYTNPGGLAGAWAVENSRDALFDALKRREVFGTSGTRIKPRFFGGWDYPENACAPGSEGVSALDEGQEALAPSGLAAVGYAQGVPMGGDLPAHSSGGAPRFIVAAQRDPRNAPLLRLEVIKGWIDDRGGAHYKVFDVAGGPDASGEIDLQSGAWSGPGHDALCAVFEDPQFDPDQPGYYYMRAVEAPSLRWSWRQCLELAPEQRPAGCGNSAPKVIQELAWSSPIWYLPE